MGAGGMESRMWFVRPWVVLWVLECDDEEGNDNRRRTRLVGRRDLCCCRRRCCNGRDDGLDTDAGSTTIIAWRYAD